MRNTSAGVLHTPSYRICKYWNILIIIYSLPCTSILILPVICRLYDYCISILILPVICRLYDYCILQRVCRSDILAIKRNKEFLVVAISIPRDFSLYNTEEFRGFPRIHEDFSCYLHMELQDRMTTVPVAMLTTVEMPATARTHKNKIYFILCRYIT